MNFSGELLSLAREQGWSDLTVMSLLIDIIEEQGHADAVLAEVRATIERESAEEAQ